MLHLINFYCSYLMNLININIYIFLTLENASRAVCFICIFFHTSQNYIPNM